MVLPWPPYRDRGPRSQARAPAREDFSALKDQQGRRGATKRGTGRAAARFRAAGEHEVHPLANGAFPDGISEAHLLTGSPVGRPFRWFMLVVLGAILLAALLGAFGGLKNPTVSASGADATLRVNAPAVLRSGEFFEMRLALEAHRPIAKPAIAVTQAYWRDLTINTMAPAPASERFEDGFFVFEFDPLEAGDAIELKVDGQVNPSLFGGTGGAVEARDDKRTLARARMELRVLP